MLHILWLIIKWILILLGILLGLVLLILLAILFVPVRYQAQGSKKESDIRLRAGVSWLCHAIHVQVWYEEKKLNKDVRLFGISLFQVKSWLEKRKARKRKKQEMAAQKKSDRQADALPPEKTPVTGAVSQISPENESTEKKKQKKAAENTLPEQSIAIEEEQTAPQMPMENPQETPGEAGAQGNVPVIAYFSKLWQMLRAIPIGVKKAVKGLWSMALKIFGTIFSLPGKILRGLEKISLTIHKICDKIDYWKNFLEDERTKSALRLVWQECKKLFSQILPRKIQGYVRFGMEDPSLTGEILAGLGMTYPLHKNQIQFFPVFDRQVLEGEVQLKGRIYGITLVVIAVKLFFDKNIKYVWNRWNHKEG